MLPSVYRFLNKPVLIALIFCAHVFVAYFVYVRFSVIPNLQEEHKLEVQELKENHLYEYEVSAAETKIQIDRMSELLSSAISNQNRVLGFADPELSPMGGMVPATAVNQLADEIAAKLKPPPMPEVTEEEIRAYQENEANIMATALSTRITPILDGLRSEQALSRTSLEAYVNKLAGEISDVLQQQLVRNQQLSSESQQLQQFTNQVLALAEDYAALQMSDSRARTSTTAGRTPNLVQLNAASIGQLSRREKAAFEAELYDRLERLQQLHRERVDALFGKKAEAAP